MTDQLAGFGTGWLPPRIARAIAIEEAHERASAVRAEQERADRTEARRESALAEFRRQAELRGDTVSALSIARGEGVGRSVGDVLAQAGAEADRLDAQQAAQARYRDGGEWVYIGSGEPVIHEPVSRSLVDEYAVDRLIRQQRDDRSWMAGYQMRLAARRGDEAARAHIQAQREAAEQAHGPDVRRSQPTSQLTNWQGRTGDLNTYQAPGTGWEAVRAEDAAGNIARRGVEGAIMSVR